MKARPQVKKVMHKTYDIIRASNDSDLLMPLWRGEDQYVGGRGRAQREGAAAALGVARLLAHEVAGERATLQAELRQTLEKLSESQEQALELRRQQVRRRRDSGRSHPGSFLCCLFHQQGRPRGGSASGS